MGQAENDDIIFTERTPWPFWLWLFLLFLTGSLSLAFWAALGNGWAIGTFVIQAVVLGFGAWKTPLRIRVQSGMLVVGPATLPIEFITEVAELSAESMQRLRGPGVNPNAFAAIRFWIPTGVQVFLSDLQDPTPYWLISSKKAHQLTGALSREINS